jgi:hypothetical protein
MFGVTPHGPHPLRAIVGHVVHAAGFGPKDRLERRRLLLVVEELGARQRAAEDTRRGHVAKDTSTMRILVHVGERIEQDVADDAVDDGCRADTQRQRRDCDRGESGIPASDPEGLADVLPQRIEDGQPTPVAIALLGLIEPTQLHERDTPRLVFGHAATAVFFDVEREVCVQFLVKGALATERRKGSTSRSRNARSDLTTPAPRATGSGPGWRSPPPTAASHEPLAGVRRASGDRSVRDGRSLRCPTRWRGTTSCSSFSSAGYSVP